MRLISKEGGKGSRKKLDDVDLHKGKTRSGEAGVRKMRHPLRSTTINNADGAGQRNNIHLLEDHGALFRPNSTP